MSRALLVSAVLVATALPFVPPAVADSCQAVFATHVGDKESDVDPIFGGPFWTPPGGGSPPTALQPNCCQGPDVPVGQYYVSLRTPAQYRMYHQPHTNGALVSDPVSAVQNGLNYPADPQYELVSLGSTDVVAEANLGVWIYQETNAHAGLQRGGTQAGLEDPCVDLLPPGVTAHDTLVL